MKIFLDVGSHSGQTLEEVVHKRYLFDVIHCFEPMPAEYNRMVERFKTAALKRRIELHNYGLLDRTCTLDLHGTNIDKGSSIFPNKERMKGREQKTPCQFKRAADFFAQNIDKNDLVVMKLNVEGSECIIMNDLLDTNECDKIDNVMIDFDIRKVPDKLDDEMLLLDRFNKEGFENYSLCDDVMVGSNHQKRIRHWLSTLEFADEIIEPTITQKIKRLLAKSHADNATSS
jgi:FkbM family methyltransferase